jgi:hypothetical protein
MIITEELIEKEMFELYGIESFFTNPLEGFKDETKTERFTIIYDKITGWEYSFDSNGAGSAYSGLVVHSENGIIFSHKDITSNIEKLEIAFRKVYTSLK